MMRTTTLQHVLWFLKSCVFEDELNGYRRVAPQKQEGDIKSDNADGKSKPFRARLSRKLSALVVVVFMTMMGVQHLLTSRSAILQSNSAKDKFLADLAVESNSKVDFQSDIVDLEHCEMYSDSKRVELESGTKDLLEKAMYDSYGPLQQRVTDNSFNRTFDEYHADMQDEYSLQLLELQLMGQGLCNFSHFRPTVAGHVLEGKRLQHVSQPHGATVVRPFRFQRTPPTSQGDAPKLYRLAIVISAFQDFDHLKDLIRAVHLPQHYIVIHIDRLCTPEYKAQIETLLATEPAYANVVLVQFGAVIYKSDTISMINLKILRWLTFDLKLDYQQAILLDASVYPLLSAMEMVESLEHLSTQQNRSVWLGQIHFSRFDSFDYSTDGRPNPDVKYMAGTRLLFTRNNNYKVMKENLYWKTLPHYVSNWFIYKTTSGNQGTYSRHVIEKLLTSDTVMELFAISKYSCCCCVEERNWAAALDSVGFGREANQYQSMFQVWGGTTRCAGSMSNSVLSTDPSLCYVSGDPFHYKNGGKSFSFHGNEMLDMIKSAKERGALFARKFRSYDKGSVELRKDIETKVWKQ